jgi:general secretion pathway protein G
MKTKAAQGTMRDRQPRKSGFTLIELMIVVAIIGILAAIAIPKFAELVRKSSEGAGKGNLRAVRSALAIYYGDMEGQYPSQLAALTIAGKYLLTIPNTKSPNYHADTSVESNGTLQAVTEGSSGWWYDNVTSDGNLGSMIVRCLHTDSKGTVWSTY